MTDWELEHIWVDKIGADSDQYKEAYNEWFHYFKCVAQEILNTNNCI